MMIFGADPISGTLAIVRASVLSNGISRFIDGTVSLLPRWVVLFIFNNYLSGVTSTFTHTPVMVGTSPITWTLAIVWTSIFSSRVLSFINFAIFLLSGGGLFLLYWWCYQGFLSTALVVLLGITVIGAAGAAVWMGLALTRVITITTTGVVGNWGILTNA